MPYARSTDGIQIHYEAFGRKSAPAVLMIQGLGADKHGWDMQRYALALKYRVVAFDSSANLSTSSTTVNGTTAP